MARPRIVGLTPRETEIMHILWDCGEANVQEVRSRLPVGLGGSTIRKLLQIMEEKGYVATRKDGRTNIYKATIDVDQVQRSALTQMINKVFRGSADALLARMVRDEHVDLDELDRVRRKLRSEKR